MALELHALELDTWTTTTVNLSNTTKTLKRTTMLLLRLKLLVDADEPQYALYFLRSPTKQKEKRRNSKYKKRSVLMHL